MKMTSVIGRSRTGDQLHQCHFVEHEGRKGYISDNASCNQRMHLRPISTCKGGKYQLKLRPGLMCVKCFGDDNARIIAREFYNAVVVE